MNGAYVVSQLLYVWESLDDHKVVVSIVLDDYEDVMIDSMHHITVSLSYRAITCQYAYNSKYLHQESIRYWC